jgi:hypothetical protein
MTSRLTKRLLPALALLAVIAVPVYTEAAGKPTYPAVHLADGRVLKGIPTKLEGEILTLPGGQTTTTLTNVDRVALRQQSATAPASGVHFEMFQRSVKELPKFSELKPSSTGITSKITGFGGRSGTVMRLKGDVYIEDDGQYTFFVTSVDGSRLLVDDKIVADNDGLHPMKEVIGNVKLTKGWHKLTMHSFAQKKATNLKVEIHGPKMERQDVTPLLRQRNKGGLTRCSLALITGGTIRGYLKSWTADALEIAAIDAVGADLQIPTAYVSELWLGSDLHVTQSRRLEAYRTEEAASDTVLVARGGALQGVNGICKGVVDGSLVFQFKGEDRRIDAGRVVGVRFAPDNRQALPKTFYCLITTTNGAVLPGVLAGLTAEQAVLQPLWGAKPMTMSLGSISQYSFRNGRLSYLSDMPPMEVKEVPYFSRVLSHRMDTTLAGKPLALDGRTWHKGIAVHTYSSLTWELAGIYDTFHATVGFEQVGGRLGQAHLRVIADGKVLFEDKDAKGSGTPEALTLNLNGARRLTLEADFGANHHVGDRIIWAGAKVLKPGETAP